MHNNLLFLDTEWANSLNRSICQIALVEYDFDQHLVINEYHSLINPLDTFDYYASSINGIVAEDVRDAPKFKDVWARINYLFNDAIVVGHNIANADLLCLCNNLRRFKLPIPNFRYIDTMEIALKYIGLNDVANYRLSTLCRYYGIYNFQAHDAKEDVLANLRLFKAMVKDFKIDVAAWVRNYDDEQAEFVFRCDKRISANNLSELYGVIKGLTIDGDLNDLELTYLDNWHKNNLINDHDGELEKIIQNILKTKKISSYEYEHLIAMLDQQLKHSNTTDNSLNLRILQGMIKGILADTNLSELEILKLNIWLEENKQLKGNYPYDQIFEAITNLVDEKMISRERRDELYILLDRYLNPDAYESKKVLVEFKNKNFVLTGDFAFGSKTEVEDYIVARLGRVKNSVSKKTDYVVCGKAGSSFYAHGHYGNKIKRAKELNIPIIKEDELFNKKI